MTIARAHRYERAIQALKDARRNAGLSQAELARQFGRSQQFISKYESGERRLDVIEYAELATIVGLQISSFADLLGETQS